MEFINIGYTQRNNVKRERSYLNCYRRKNTGKMAFERYRQLGGGGHGD